MKLNFILLLFVLAPTSSCFDNTYSSDKNEQHYEEITPDLENYESYGGANDLIGSFSKRYSQNIISSLYEDAIKKDVKLKTLNKKIENMNELKQDSLEAYQEYLDFNTDYWNAVKGYNRQIRDSATSATVQQLFKKLEDKYDTNELPYTTKNKTIERLNTDLNDQLILMQLAVSASMMDNYRKNQHPSIEPLENLIKKYEALIEETKEYMEIKK